MQRTSGLVVMKFSLISMNKSTVCVTNIALITKYLTLVGLIIVVNKLIVLCRRYLKHPSVLEEVRLRSDS